MFRSIRVKIFTGMLALSFLFIIIAVAIMNLFLGRIVDEEIATSLAKSRIAFEQYSAVRAELLGRQALSFAETPYLKATLSIPEVDHETLLFTAQDLFRAAASDILLLVNPAGDLLADATDSSSERMSLGTLPGLSEALAGQSVVRTGRYRGELFNFALSPIIVGDRTLGVLALGRRVSSPESLKRLMRVTGANVFVVDQGRRIAGEQYGEEKVSVGEAEIPFIVAAAGTRDAVHDSAGPAQKAFMGGRPSLFEAVPLPGEKSFLVFYRPLDEIADKVEPVRRIVFVAGGLCLLLAVVFSHWLSTRVSDPLIRLKTVVERFGAGAWEERVRDLPSDEVGRLGEAFNGMADDLKKTTVSRDYFDNILRSMIDTLLVVSPEGRIVIMNRAVTSLLGYEETQLLGQSLGTVLPEFGDRDSAAARRAWFEEASARPRSTEYVARDGEKIPVALSASVLRDSSGEIAAFVSVARDIREFLKLQEEKLQAEKLATMGSMAAIMAHELKNRMAVITGASGLLRMSVDPEGLGAGDLEEVFSQMEREIDRATRLINDVLTFAKPQKASPASVDLRRLVERIVERNGGALAKQGVRISFQDFPPAATAQADEEQIEEALEHLFRNAVEAQPGGGLISFAAEIRGGASPRVVLSLRDQGPGMDEKTLAKAFEPFFTTREFGTGLGLGAARSLIEANGGVCAIISAPGEGTRVTIDLPGA